jgi:hypothetical protein
MVEQMRSFHRDHFTMRPFLILSVAGLGALASPDAAQASGSIYYNGPGAHRHYGVAGPVVHRWAPAPRRHARRDQRRALVAGAVAGAVVGGVVAAAVSRPRVHHSYQHVDHSYWGHARPAPVYAGSGYYPASAGYHRQPYCFQTSERLFNSQGVYRGVFPVQVCR